MVKYIPGTRYRFLFIPWVLLTMGSRNTRSYGVMIPRDEEGGCVNRLGVARSVFRFFIATTAGRFRSVFQGFRADI